MKLKMERIRINSVPTRSFTFDLPLLLSAEKFRSALVNTNLNEEQTRSVPKTSSFLNNNTNKPLYFFSA